MSDNQLPDGIKIRRMPNPCPICKDGEMTAIETLGTYVDCYCAKCKAKFDVEPYYNPITKQRWLRAWHRNPDYWSLSNPSLVQGREKDMSQTKIYKGSCYLVEKLPAPAPTETK